MVLIAIVCKFATKGFCNLKRVYCFGILSVGKKNPCQNPFFLFCLNHSYFAQSMNKIARRKFLKSLFLGSGIFFLPLSVWGKSNVSTALSPSSDLVKLAKQAFYKKEYAHAEELYKQLILQESNNIEHYDGLRKVYGAQQRLTDVALLYKQGLSQNQNQSVFYDRLARSINSIALGNRKEEKNYKYKQGSEDLLLASVGLYILAIPKFPKDQSLRLGLKDTIRCFDLRSIMNNLKDKLPTILNLSAQKLITSLKDNRGKKENDKGLSVEEITELRIAQMGSKKRRELYFDDEKRSREMSMRKQKKHWQTRQVKKSFENNNLELAKNQVQEILKQDPKETHLFGAIKKQAYKNKNNDIVVSLYKEKYETKKDFWTLIGYGTALRKQNSQTNFNRIISLYDEAEQVGLPKKALAIDALYSGRALTYFDNNEFDKGRKEILQAMDVTNGCGSVSWRLTIYYAQSYATQGDYSTALDLLKILKGESIDSTLDNPIVRFIQPNEETDETIYYIHQISNRSRNKEEQLDILYAVAKISEKQQDYTTLNQTIDEIKAIDPQNKFAAKFS